MYVHVADVHVQTIADVCVHVADVHVQTVLKCVHVADVCVHGADVCKCREVEV